MHHLIEQLEHADVIVTTTAIFEQLKADPECPVENEDGNFAEVCGYPCYHYETEVIANEEARNMANGQNAMLLTDTDLEIDDEQPARSNDDDEH